MRFPWFSKRQNSAIDSPRQQSQGINIFSSKSRHGKSSSPKKMSGRKEQGNSSSRDCIVRIGCPLPSSEELQNVFNKFDANGDGKISPSELGHVMRSLGNNATEDEVQRMMAEADSDGDGYVDLSEFVALNTRGVDNAASLRDLKDAFDMFDMDGNGSISADELHRVLMNLGETSSLDECCHMIRGVDADGDGQVSFDEFFTICQVPLQCKTISSVLRLLTDCCLNFTQGKYQANCKISLFAEEQFSSPVGHTGELRARTRPPMRKESVFEEPN